MTAWKDEQLAEIAAVDELRIAPLRRDGTLQPRHATHISVGSVDADVVFEDADHDLDVAIDDRRKYGRSSSAVDHITSPKARSPTIRLVPS
jgi:hypothetical protein